MYIYIHDIYIYIYIHTKPPGQDFSGNNRKMFLLSQSSGLA